MQVCLSHGGPNLYQGNESPDHALVATLSGVVGLTAGPDGWQETSRSLVGKHVSALLDSPSASGLIFAGTHGHGLYRSQNNGKRWERVRQGLPSENVYALNAKEKDGQLRVYAGTEPAHLYVSNDMGETWEELAGLQEVPSVESWSFPAEPHWAHIRGIAFDPRSDQTIYVAIEVGGFFRSNDEGRSWQEFRGYYEDVHRMAFRPGQPDSVYLATGNGLWHSTDAGAQWTALTNRSHRVSYPDGLIIHPDKPDLMFIAGAISRPNGWRETHMANARVARSRNAGTTWDIPEAGFPDPMRGNIDAMSMALFPGGCLLIVGTTDGTVFTSADEGDTWIMVAEGLPPVSIGDHYVRLTAPAAAGRDNVLPAQASESIGAK